MSSPGKRIVEGWELDWAAAKAKWRSKIKSTVQKLEQGVMESPQWKKYCRVPSEPELLPDGSRRGTSRWLLDGKLSFLGLLEESDDELAHRRREVIGFLKVRVKSMECSKYCSKAYFELLVEGEELQSPVAFQCAGNEGINAFVWEFEGRFPITDITGSFCINVFSKSTLAASDEQLGTLIVPFYSLLGGRSGSGPLAQTAVYNLFPPHKGVPGHRRAYGTGLDRDAFDESFRITVRHEVCLLGPTKVIWPLYLRNRRYIPRFAAKGDRAEQERVATLNAPLEMLESVKDLKRSLSRIETAVVEMLASLPVLLLLHLRSWRNPVLSGGVCLITLCAARWLPHWAAPLVIFVITAVLCVLSKKTNHVNSNWVVWNDDIDRDPDSELTTVQQLGKLARRVDRATKIVAIIATLLEKSVNAWNFADPVATIIMLQFLFACTIGWTVAVWFCNFCNISLYGPAVVGLLIIPIPRDRGVFSVFRLWALSVFDRVPTHDDLGRVWLARQQVVRVLE